MTVIIESFIFETEEDTPIDYRSAGEDDSKSHNRYNWTQTRWSQNWSKRLFIVKIHPTQRPISQPLYETLYRTRQPISCQAFIQCEAQENVGIQGFF